MTSILIGKKIKQIKIADDKHAILFCCEDGDVKALCDAECCSNTWIEHIELPALGFPALVVAVDALDLPGSDHNHPEYDCLQVYGCKITTDKGDIVIDYRNSSNGEYGGHLLWPDTPGYRMLEAQNISTENWADVVGDI